MSRWARCIVSLAVLTVLSKTSRACFCMALADESKICQADFAVRATVLQMDSATISFPGGAGNVGLSLNSSSEERAIFRYVVRIEDVFRLSRSLVTAVKPRSSNVTIVTLNEPCKAVDDLEVGSTYFIAGSFYEGMPGISRCSSVIAVYREDDVVPYRDNDVKVDVNPECPEDYDVERYMHLDAVEDYDNGDVYTYGSAPASRFEFGLLVSLMTTALLLVMGPSV